MKRKKLMIFLCIIIVVLFIAVTAFVQKKREKPVTTEVMQTYTVSRQQTSQTLYFSGNILPLKRYSVITPIAGTVSSTYFEFGHTVKKGQLLYKVAMQGKDLQTLLTSFLKAKSDLSTAQTTKDSADLLYNNDIMAKKDYDSANQSYYTAKLAYIQAEQAFQQSINSLQGHEDSEQYLSQLTNSLNINKLAEVQKALTLIQQKLNHVDIYSPASGVILIQSSSSSSGGNSSGSAKIGSQVKQGQMLAEIGTMQGILIRIHVPEALVEKINPGQVVEVSMNTLSGIVLQGKITSISLQAKTSGSVPQFDATITVNQLSAEAQKEMRFGISAKVSCKIEGAKQILIPIDAILDNNGRTMVRLQSVDGSVKTVPVVTGQTMQDSVVITSGLKAGDKILVADKTASN